MTETVDPANRAVQTYELGRQSGPYQRAYLHLLGIRRTREGFTVRVFVNAPDADRQTLLTDEHYAGDVFTFGSGASDATSEFGEPTLDAMLDITKAMRAVHDPSSPLLVTLVVTDSSGGPGEAGLLRLDSLRVDLQP